MSSTTKLLLPMCSVNGDVLRRAASYVRQALVLRRFSSLSWMRLTARSQRSGGRGWHLRWSSCCEGWQGAGIRQQGVNCCWRRPSDAAGKARVSFIPQADSEHSAILQCLIGESLLTSREFGSPAWVVRPSDILVSISRMSRRRRFWRIQPEDGCQDHHRLVQRS